MKHLKRLVSDAVSGIPIDFGGGCSVSKGYLIAWLIQRFKITASVDIGVYRGRSLVPQALAHKESAGGMAYGVDPWLNSEVHETGNPTLLDAIEDFVRTTDFPAIYQEVQRMINTLGLEQNCTLVRQRSADAIQFFERERMKFGLIHIDGNHDTNRVLADLTLYVPRLQTGGFVVMDDMSWNSVKAALPALPSRLTKIYERQDPANDYAIFWDAPSAGAATILQARLLWVGRG